jgi:hypothetical protein
VGSTSTTAQSTATSTEAGALSMATHTVTGASNLANDTVRDADRKVATVLTVATDTATAGVTTITSTLKAVNAGAGVEASNATGWMTVKAGDVILAHWEVKGASTTATIATPAGGFTVTYTGDQTFASATRSVLA